MQYDRHHLNAGLWRRREAAWVLGLARPHDPTNLVHRVEAGVLRPTDPMMDTYGVVHMGVGPYTEFVRQVNSTWPVRAEQFNSHNELVSNSLDQELVEKFLIKSSIAGR